MGQEGSTMPLDQGKHSTYLECFEKPLEGCEQGGRGPTRGSSRVLFSEQQQHRLGAC